MTRLGNVGLGVVALLAAACGEVIYGNGERATERREASGFTKIESAGSVDVSVERAEEFSVLVSLDSNLIPELETRVVGDTLIIDHHPDFEDMVAGPHVLVTLPDPRGAELSGSGDLDVVAPEVQPALALALSGSGRVTFRGSAPRMTVHLGGSGDVVLRGEGEAVTYRLSGSGHIDARNYESSEGIISLSGSGSIHAALAESADIDISGSGDVHLYGHPDVTRLSIDGSGAVHEE